MSLAVTGLCKAYGALRVVDAVTFTAPAAGMVGIIGPNGAGKSSLFSVLTGFQPADAGQIRFGEHEITHSGAVARAQAGLVRTFQVPREFTHLSVRENLMAAAPGQAGERLLDVFLRPGRVRAKEAEVARDADETIAFLRLDAVAAQPAGRLSGGQKKLLELGRALMTGARMILLDEPFAGVNPVLIEEIANRIRTLNGRGIGFLIIEHDLAALARLVSEFHVMDRGRLIASGAPAAVLADPAVREAYLGGLS